MALLPRGGKSHCFRGGEAGGSERPFRRTDLQRSEAEKSDENPPAGPTFNVWRGIACPIRQTLGPDPTQKARECLGRGKGWTSGKAETQGHPPDDRPRSRVGAERSSLMTTKRGLWEEHSRDLAERGAEHAYEPREDK